MNAKERVYLASPLWLQRMAGAAYGAVWKRRRFGPVFHRTVEELRGRTSWTAGDFAAHQSVMAGRLLEAAQRSPYYAAHVPNDWRDEPLQAIRSMPELSKETLRTRGTDLFTGTAPRGTTTLRSSGTTGTPIEVAYTRDFHQIVQAYFEVRVRAAAGVSYADRRVMFGARKVCAPQQTKPPFWRHVPAEDLAYCSIYHLSERNLPSYVEFLGAFRPVVVMGYPNALAEVARFAIEHGEGLPGARAVLTSSETLSPSIRSLLERAWGVPIVDSYGAVEACALAVSCPAGRMHVSTDFGLVEIIGPTGAPCAPGELGEIVATGLENTLQPLIRYRLGDTATWAPGPCTCDSPFPAIEAVHGRSEDVCFTPDGRAIVRFDTVFKGVSGLREAQVVQTHPDRFELRVATDARFTDADQRTLVKNMQTHVGSLQVEVVRVPSIPRTPAGKFRPVVSHVRRPVAAAEPEA